MVWWGDSWNRVTQLHFYESRVKKSAKVYQVDILKGSVLSFNESLLNGEHWSFNKILHQLIK